MDSEDPLNPTPWESVVENTKKRPTTVKERDPRTIKRQQTSHISDSTPIIVSNSFNVLSDMTTDSTDTTSDTVPAKEKVPPIYLNNVTSSSNLIKTLNEQGGKDSFTLRSTAKNNIIINPKTPTAYRTFVRYFETNNADFHTFQLKSEKRQTIVIRGLHYTTDPADIKSALQTLGYTAENITNVLSRRVAILDDNNRQSVIRNPLSLFFVEISTDSYNDEIYDIKFLLSYSIKIEEPYKKRSIPQCTRCQSYSHTKTYCRHPHKCVRCGQDHASGACQKTRDTPATCANCNGSHPANYKGCVTYQSLINQRQKRNSELNNSRPPPPPPVSQGNFPSLPTKPAAWRTTASYSQAASRNHHSTQEHTSHNNIPERESSQWSPAGANSASYEVVSFMTDLNKIIQPLFSLLTQLTQFTQSFMQRYGH